MLALRQAVTVTRTTQGCEHAAGDTKDVPQPPDAELSSAVPGRNALNSATGPPPLRDPRTVEADEMTSLPEPGRMSAGPSGRTARTVPVFTVMALPLSWEVRVNRGRVVGGGELPVGRGPTTGGVGPK